MGLFDIFKKKEESKHPLQSYLEEGDLAIDNLQVAEMDGVVTLSGSTQDGASIAKALKMLKAKGVTGVTNQVRLANLKHLGIMYTLETNGKSLNCRKGPGKKEPIVGKFPSNASVCLVQKYSASWYKVSSNEIEGYCQTDYLKLKEK
jgi:hypothetical protein